MLLQWPGRLISESQPRMTEALDPAAWAHDVLGAYTILPLADGEDERRLLGELLMLPWIVSWSEEPPYEVRGKMAWLPVGEVQFVVRGQTLAEAAMFGLAMALQLQGKDVSKEEQI